MTHPLTLYVLALIFTNVFVAQLGVPIPAVPSMIAAGALGADGQISAMASLGLAVIASVIADSIWYLVGRTHGDRMLELVGRVSLSLKFHIEKVNDHFDRWGPLALTLAKFVPGISTLAPALAGSGGVSYLRFILFDALGALCWAGTALVIGMLFGGEIEKVGFVLP
jgi:membrane protein DedA with SNARE-associated domain